MATYNCQCDNEYEEEVGEQTVNVALNQRIIRNLRSQPLGTVVTSKDGRYQFRLNPETGAAEVRQRVDNCSADEDDDFTDLLELPPGTPSVVDGVQLDPYLSTNYANSDTLLTPRTTEFVVNERNREIEETARRRAAGGRKVAVIDYDADPDLLPLPRTFG